MSHYSLEELIARWKQEKATPEQVIGQILQWLSIHDERLRELERARREANESTPAPPSHRRTVA